MKRNNILCLPFILYNVEGYHVKMNVSQYKRERNDKFES